jgi:heme/copper-type cytochrome/quinol oxidase subunit 2/plastocyanin
MRGAFLVAALATLLAVPTVSAGWGMPEPLTERGEIVTAMYEKIAIVGVLVFALVFALLVWILFRYREETGHGRATHEAHRGSLKAEAIWTLIPLGIMLWIGVMAYGGLVQLDKEIPIDEAEMSVTVTGYQWAWEMDYGGGVVASVAASPDAAGRLSYTDTFHLPANTKILFNITGADVIHAFNIMDANRAYVSMDDANPSGPHKVHQQVMMFPAGKYTIQCKEMCLNPGHGYMRAELIVEPMPAFRAWLEDRQLAVGAELVSRVSMQSTASGISSPDDLTVVAGSRVIVRFENTLADPITLTMGGGNFVNETIPGRSTALFAFDTGVPGDYTLTASNGGRLAFNAIEATPVSVDLGNYVLNPKHLDLQAGTTYLITLKNVHSTIHNLYIGDHPGQALAKSPNLQPGAGGSFVWTATRGNFDMWCDVAGHHELGMFGTISVA